VLLGVLCGDICMGIVVEDDFAVRLAGFRWKWAAQAQPQERQGNAGKGHFLEVFSWRSWRFI